MSGLWWPATSIDFVTIPTLAERHNLLVGLPRPTLAAQLTEKFETATVQDAWAVAFGWPGRTQPVPRQALAAESTVEPRCGSGLAVPAGLVGWSEPGNQAKGGEAS